MQIDRHKLAQINEYVEQWLKNEVPASEFEVGDVVNCYPGDNLGVVVEIDKMEGIVYVAWYDNKDDAVSISYGWELTLLERPSKPKVEPKAIGVIGHVSQGKAELSGIVAALAIAKHGGSQVSKTMTPSEIAEWLDGISDDAGGYGWIDTSGNLSKAAGTIRAQAEALKIEREALKKMVALYESEHDPESLKRPQWLAEALARIKEVV